MVSIYDLWEVVHGLFKEPIIVMIPEPCVTLQGSATGRIQRHIIPERRITLQGAGTW